MAAWIMSSGRMVPPPERAVAPALLMVPNGFVSKESAGIWERDVKIFLILKLPSSWITSIVFIEFELVPLFAAFLVCSMLATLDI